MTAAEQFVKNTNAETPTSRKTLLIYLPIYLMAAGGQYTEVVPIPIKYYGPLVVVLQIFFH